MKNTLLLLSLSGVIIFSVACDKGKAFGFPDDVAVVVTVEREIRKDTNAVLKVFTNDLNLNRDAENNVLLVFTCPCYLGWHTIDFSSSVIKVNDQQGMSVKLLSGAPYNIEEVHLKSGEKRSYYFPVK